MSGVFSSDGSGEPSCCGQGVPGHAGRYLAVSPTAAAELGAVPGRSQGKPGAVGGCLMNESVRPATV